jgi:hypothetical protein
MDNQKEVGSPDDFIALRWQKERATAFLDWRRGEGLVRECMSTLCDAIGDTVGTIDPHWVAAHLDDVMRGRSCDNLAFDDIGQVIAYMLMHMSDRYARATHALEILFTAGCLPTRRRRLSVLDVGSGPAPCAYAALDFYLQLMAWTMQTGQNRTFSTVTDLHLLDRGEAWGTSVHWLSENLLPWRQNLFSMTEPLGMPIPFAITYRDFKGFSARDLHNRAREYRARVIQGEMDDPDSLLPSAADYSTPAARRLAYEEYADKPSAYDLVFLGNFLTQLQHVEIFRRELPTLARWLTPGGALVIFGGHGKKYEEIRSAVRDLLSHEKVILIEDAENTVSAGFDPVIGSLSRNQRLVNLTMLRKSGAELPEVVTKRRKNSHFAKSTIQIFVKRDVSRAVRRRRRIKGSGAA